MKRKLLLLLLIVHGVFYSHVQQGSSNDKKEILKVVQEFFDAMEARDTVAFGNTAISEGYHFYVRESKDSATIGSRPHSRFNGSLATSKSTIREKLRNTGVNVQIHKRIATVWGPYDLWVDGKFSHCGVDVFTLFKTVKGWKIASVAYSVEIEECDQEIK